MKDELMKTFGTAGLPASDDPHINNTSGATAPTGESTAPFGGVANYAPPASNLPEHVSQSTILADSEARGLTPWTGDNNEEV